MPRAAGAFAFREMSNGSHVRVGYYSKANLKLEVLDFVEFGGPEGTGDGTVFEMGLDGSQ